MKDEETSDGKEEETCQHRQRDRGDDWRRVDWPVENDDQTAGEY